MIGPHYERLAQIEQRMTAKQMLSKIKGRPDNPLTRVIDKLKKQFSEYETAYDDPIMDHQITSLDRILSSDSKLGPILDALEKQNLLLRRELGTLEGQLSNTVGICEQILGENNELKIIIKKKNEDISKIIETIAHNQAAGMDELQEKNNLLLHENSMLMSHLQAARKEHQKYSEMFRDGDQEKGYLQKRSEEMKKQLNESIGRERDLSRKISMLEQSLYQQSEEVYQLQQAKQNLTFENNEMKNQMLVVQGKAEAEGSETLRKRMQKQYEPMVEEHKALKKERTQLLRECERLKLEKERLQDLQGGFEQKANKLQGDLELTTSLLVEQKNKSAYLENAVAKLQGRVNQLKEENNRFRAEKQAGDTYSSNRQKRLLQEIDDLRAALEDKQSEIERRMKEIRESMQGLLQSKETELRQLREENVSLQRLIDRR